MNLAKYKNIPGLQIISAATEINEAYLEKFLLPQLIKEYVNDNQGLLSFMPAVPAAAVGKEGIYKNRLIDDVEAVINNTTDFTLGSYDKKSYLVPWDYVDTRPQKVTRSAVRAMVYDEGAELRRRHMAKIMRKTRDLLVHRLCPDEHSTDTPAIKLDTNDKFSETLWGLRETLVNMDIDPRDTLVILAPKHVKEIGLEQGFGDKFREALFDERTGEPKGFGGFPNVIEHNKMPYFSNADEKTAFGSVVAGTDRVASVVIHLPQVIFHREGMELYFKPKRQDTRSADPGDEFRVGGYFAASKIIDKGFAAIY